MPQPNQPPPAKKGPERVDLRLFNAIVIFDTYVVAREGQTARDALIELLKAGEIEPSEVVAKEVSSINSVRASCVDQPPLVAPDVTDEEFATLKGITNGQAFERFYKHTKKAEPAKKPTK